jgi:hypothetical protein
MTLPEAIQIVGSRPDWELKAIRAALSMHSWLNTPEERLRLQAVKLVISHRRRSRKHGN